VDESRYWLAFTLVQGIGPVKTRALVEHFGSLCDAWHANAGELQQAGLDKRALKNVLDAREQIDLDRQWARLQKSGAHFLTWNDDGYPIRLKEIDSVMMIGDIDRTVQGQQPVPCYPMHKHRLGPVVGGMVQLIGLGRCEQDPVRTGRKQRTEPTAAPDSETVEHRHHGVLQVAHGLGSGVERSQHIDQHAQALPILQPVIPVLGHGDGFGRLPGSQGRLSVAAGTLPGRHDLRPEAQRQRRLRQQGQRPGGGDPHLGQGHLRRRRHGARPGIAARGEQTNQRGAGTRAYPTG